MNWRSIPADAAEDAAIAGSKIKIRSVRSDSMGEKEKIAEELFFQGFNCSQSVFAAFSEEVGMDRESALKLASSFGGGMGRLREVCGAVSAMFMIAGLKDGYSDPKDDEAKAEHYRLIQRLAEQFKEENGSIICRELLGLPCQADSPTPEARTRGYYERRPCAELVKSAARITEEYLEGKSV